MKRRSKVRKAWAKRVEDGHVPSLRAEADAGTGVLYLYDPIDSWFGVTARDLVEALDSLGDVDQVDLHINSPGGDVFDAIAFLNTLRAHPARVVSYVDGIAASAASFVAAGTDELVMGENATMMIHDAWTITIGDADAMRETAELLDRVSDNIASIYAQKAAGDVADWRAFMRAETWYVGEEAVTAGLADRVSSDVGTSDDEPVAAILIPTIAAARPAAQLTERETSMDPCTTCGHRHDPAASCPTAVPAGAAPPPTPAGPAPAASLTPAAVPAGLQQAIPPSRPADAIGSLDEFYAAMSQRHSGRLTPELQNALTDITQTAVGVDVEQPAWIGELWSHVRYQRKIVPLLGGAKKLTSYKVQGWRWLVAPEVDDWAGDKTAVPSNQPTTEPADTEASRLAGAHDIDRKFRDFNDTAFFQAYYEAMTESYAIKSDAALLAALLAGATDEATPAYVGFLGAVAAGVAMIDDSTGAGSTFVVANKADLIPWVLDTTNLDMPAKLESIGVNVDRIVTHSGMTAGHVLVGTAPAADYYELPGSPIRVEAIDMTKGGVDAGVFGYYAALIHNAAGLVDVVIDTTP